MGGAINIPHDRGIGLDDPGELPIRRVENKPSLWDG
jgi:hypothetical protein